MSKLRQTFLEWIRIAGNHSGCHQLPERSFFYKGKQFPVCARCTGVTAGQLLALIAGLYLTVPVRVSSCLLVIMGCDWSLQQSGIKPSTNCRRFITGLAGGFGLFSIYIYVFKTLKRRVAGLI